MHASFQYQQVNRRMWLFNISPRLGIQERGWAVAAWIVSGLLVSVVRNFSGNWGLMNSSLNIYFRSDQEYLGFTITTGKVQTWQFAFLSGHIKYFEGLFIFSRKMNRTVNYLFLSSLLTAYDHSCFWSRYPWFGCVGINHFHQNCYTLICRICPHNVLLLMC